MATIVVAQRMYQRRDTAANWSSKNPVLAAGEIGVQLGATANDPQTFKIGNGVTPWNTLAFSGAGVGGGTTWYTGSGAPSNTLGVDGDFYLRSSNSDVYRKASGAWSVVANIRGQQGVQGTPGINGKNPEFQFSTTHFQYRLIGDSTWLDLYPIESLRGPAGQDGADGQDAPSITRTSLVLSAPMGMTVADVAPTFKMMRLFRCEGDRPFRLRLYSTVAERDADLSRQRGTDAALGSGLLFEFIGVAGLLGANLSPVPVVYNNESTPLSQIAYTLEADSGEPTIVTLSVMEIQP
jgi:hypothetical protein